MTVWIVPAADKTSEQNFAKTLSSPISDSRLTKIKPYLPNVNHGLFAWGFPRNETNSAKWMRMQPGDICFFYGRHAVSNRYIFAAKVVQPLFDEPELVSQALWDEPTFLPYLLEKPIELSITTEDFGRSLNSTGTYMTSHPMGALALSDESRATPAIEEFGSFDSWASNLIHTHSELGFSNEDVPNEDDTAEQVILLRSDITETEKLQLIRARCGQGTYRRKLIQIEKKCRVTGLGDLEHLRASHIKPWRYSTDYEKLDGYNGLLLSPHIDHLFDRGLISFHEDGRILFSSSINAKLLSAWSIDPNTTVGTFHHRQLEYLAYHRSNIFKKA